MEIKKYLLFLFSLSFFINSHLHSQTLNDYFSPTELKILVQVQSLIHNTHFEKAESLLTNSKSNISESTYLFFIQVNYFWRYVYTKNDSFLILTNKYGEKNKIFIESKQITESLKNDFFLGATYGYLDLSKAMDNSITRAIGDGKKGYNYLNYIYKKYPNFREAELGLGIYEGFVAKLPKLLRWLVYPFGIKGNMSSSIKHLTNSSGKGLLTKADAMFFKYAFLEKANPEKLSILDSLKTNYPDNPLYHFLIGLNFYQNKKYSQAKAELELSSKLMDKSFKDIRASSLSYLAKSDYFLKNYKKCISLYLGLENYYLQKGDKSSANELFTYVSKVMKHWARNLKQQNIFIKLKIQTYIKV
jgi:hypothetical protein